MSWIQTPRGSFQREKASHVGETQRLSATDTHGLHSAPALRSLGDSGKRSQPFTALSQGITLYFSNYIPLIFYLKVFLNNKFKINWSLSFGDLCSRVSRTERGSHVWSGLNGCFSPLQPRGYAVGLQVRTGAFSCTSSASLMAREEGKQIEDWLK